MLVKSTDKYLLVALSDQKMIIFYRDINIRTCGIGRESATFIKTNDIRIKSTNFI